MPLTDTDMKRLALAWQCFDTEPKIDYEKFREVAGLASAHSARELMRVTKNKLKNEYGSLSASVAAAKPGKSATPNKKRNIATADSDAGGEGTPTPTPKKRGRPTKVVVNHNDEDGENEGEHMPTPKKARKANGVKKVKDEPVEQADGEAAEEANGWFE